MKQKKLSPTHQPRAPLTHFPDSSKVSQFFSLPCRGLAKKYFALFIANCVCSKILLVPFSTRLWKVDGGSLLTGPPTPILSQIKIQSLWRKCGAERKILKSKGKQHSSRVLLRMIRPSGAAPRLGTIVCKYASESFTNIACEKAEGAMIDL